MVQFSSLSKSFKSLLLNHTHCDKVCLRCGQCGF